MEEFRKFMVGYCEGVVKAAKAVGAVVSVVVGVKKLTK